jgi:hypothetical protein
MKKLKQLNGTLLSRRAQQAVTGGKNAVICVVWFIPFNTPAAAVALPGNGVCEGSLQQCQASAATACTAVGFLPVPGNCVNYCYEISDNPS